MQIRLERTLDYQLVGAIMRTPEIYRAIADDYYPPREEFTPIQNTAMYYLLAYDYTELCGLCTTHPINAALWEVHHALLPQAWGGRAHCIGWEFIGWIWRNTPAETIIGLTPAWNRLAVRYARRHNMTERGRIPRATRRGGEYSDLIIFSQSRG